MGSKGSSIVEMVIVTGIDGLGERAIERFDWDKDCPDMPLPPKNTQIAGCFGMPPTTMIAVDKDTKKGYALDVDNKGNAYWRPN